MDISRRTLSRVDILTLSGRLDAASEQELRSLIDEMLNEGRARIVLDLSQLETLSSAGLRVIIEARKRARALSLTNIEGGDVRLAAPTEYVRELLDLTGFTTTFEIFPDLVGAVGSF